MTSTTYMIPILFSLKSMGLPVIPVRMFDTEHHILLLADTGADKSIMDRSVLDRFKEQAQEIGRGTEVTTANNTSTEAISALFRFSYEGHDYMEPFICMDCSLGFDKIKEETGYRPHGILGTDFLVKHQWVIDFEKGIILAR